MRFLATGLAPNQDSKLLEKMIAKSKQRDIEEAAKKAAKKEKKAANKKSFTGTSDSHSLQQQDAESVSSATSKNTVGSWIGRRTRNNTTIRSVEGKKPPSTFVVQHAGRCAGSQGVVGPPPAAAVVAGQCSEEESVSAKKKKEQKSTTNTIINTSNNKSAEEQQLAMETIRNIQDTINCQEGREKELEDQRCDTLKKAKSKLSDGNKVAALRAMKKVKMLELEKSKITSAIETMEAQIFAIESAMHNKRVMETMQDGANTMKILNNECNVGNVTAVMEDVLQNMDYADEVRDILSQPVDHVILPDDHDLLAELDDIMFDEKAKEPQLATDAMDVEDAMTLPTAPTSALHSQPHGLLEI